MTEENGKGRGPRTRPGHSIGQYDTPHNLLQLSEPPFSSSWSIDPSNHKKRIQLYSLLSFQRIRKQEKNLKVYLWKRLKSKQQTNFFYDSEIWNLFLAFQKQTTFGYDLCKFSLLWMLFQRFIYELICFQYNWLLCVLLSKVFLHLLIGSTLFMSWLVIVLSWNSFCRFFTIWSNLRMSRISI